MTQRASHKNTALIDTLGMPSFRYSIVDAFTTTPFKGNAAAVVVLDSGSPPLDATLQCIAAEFNVSNTAFVTPVDPSRVLFNLRWFTPKVEVALCGHASLATASVLFSRPDLLPKSATAVEFKTLSGVLVAKRLPDGRIELELPAGEVIALQDTIKEKVETIVQRALQPSAALSVQFVGAGQGVPFRTFILVEVDGVDLENLSIRAGPINDLAPLYTACVLTHRGRDRSETFVSCVFAPAMGVPEDPVTGSAHCMLGPYWAQKLQVHNDTEMIGRQVSFRSGEIGVVWEREKGTCRIRGHAALVATGELYLPK